jgi:hypothetical protein
MYETIGSTYSASASASATASASSTKSFADSFVIATTTATDLANRVAKDELNKTLQNTLVRDFISNSGNNFLKNILNNYPNDIKLTNNFNRTMKNTTYNELLFFYQQDKAYIYNSYFVKNQFTTQDTTDLNFSETDIIIKGRTFVVDNNIWLDILKGTDTYPKYKYYTFKNSTISVAYELICSSIPNLDPKNYEFAGIVERINSWIYYPNSNIYLLIDTNDKKIYAMQTFTSEIVTYDELIVLNTRLTLPEGWIYCYLTLDNNQYFFVTSNKDAKVIKDNLENGYQYVKYEDAPFLYDKYLS